MPNIIEAYNSVSLFFHRVEKFICGITGSQGQNRAGTKLRPTSLTNDGATCYLNSAFQGISSCNIFVRDIEELSTKYGNENVKNLYLFIQLMSILNGSSKTQMSISRNPIFRQWNKSGQQDCYELLAYALNQVYNELRSYKESKGEIAKRDLQAWLQERLPMRIIILYNITCGCKNQARCPLQSDLALHVTIPTDTRRCTRLGELIDKYFEDDFIEDYDCDQQGCNGNGAKRQARLVRPLPNTICIHLQRSHWDGYKMKKINTKVSFERTLKLKESYLYEEDDYKNVFVKDDSQSEPAGEFFTSSTNECAPKLNGGCSKLLNQNENGEALTHRQCMEPPYLPGETCTPLQDSSDQTCHLTNEQTQLGSNSEITELDKSIQPHNIKYSITSSQEHVNNKNDSLEAHKDPNDVHNQENVIDRSSSQLGTKGHSPLMSGNQNRTDKRHSSLSKGKRNEDYRLVSVIVHSGTVSGGHYVCYKCVEDQWYLTDDSSIREVNEGDVLGCNPYVLFYEQNSSS